TEEDLFFHLSCEFPSTVAFANFRRPELDLVRLEEVPARTSHSRETFGSWLDPATQALYCVTGEGSLYRVCRPARTVERLARLPLAGPSCVPLHVIHGGGGRLFVGASRDTWERSLGLVSAVWPVAAATGMVGPAVELPFPILNFVVDDGGE